MMTKNVLFILILFNSVSLFSSFSIQKTFCHYLSKHFPFYSFIFLSPFLFCNTVKVTNNTPTHIVPAIFFFCVIHFSSFAFVVDSDFIHFVHSYAHRHPNRPITKAKIIFFFSCAGSLYVCHCTLNTNVIVLTVKNRKRQKKKLFNIIHFV